MRSRSESWRPDRQAAASRIDRLQISWMLRPSMVTPSDAGFSRARDTPGTAPRGCTPRSARDSAIALGFGVPALEPRDHTLEAGVVLPLTAVAVLVANLDLRTSRALEHDLLRRLFQLLPRHVHREVVLGGQRTQHPVEVLAPKSRPRSDGAVVDAQLVIGHHELRIDLEPRTQSVAALARTVAASGTRSSVAPARRTRARSGCTRDAPRR